MPWPRQVRASIDRGKLPDIELPVRRLDNVSYDEAKGYFELGDARKVRTLTVNTARSFAQTLRLMAASRAMVEHDDFATKREVYYISKNWGDCRFDEQAESDAIMDDIEALASTAGAVAGTAALLSRIPRRLGGRQSRGDRHGSRERRTASRSTAPTSAVVPTAFRARSSSFSFAPTPSSCSPSKPAACSSA